MAVIRAYQDGVIGSVWITPQEVAGILPGGQPANQLELDADTNLALLQDVRRNMAAYRLRAGVLTKNGAPVQVEAEGEDATERRALAALIGEIDAYLATPVTPDADFSTFLAVPNPNTSQTAAALKALVRATPTHEVEARAIRRLSRLMKFALRRLQREGLLG